MSNLLGVALGGSIGVAGSIVSNWFLESYRRERLKESAALAFRGEISSLLILIDRRDYINHLKSVKAYMEENREVRNFSFYAEREYFFVYKNYIDKIGLFSNPLPYKITKFYTLASALLEDVERINKQGLLTANVDEAIRFYDEMANFMEEIVTTGHDIVEIIDSRYSH